MNDWQLRLAEMVLGELSAEEGYGHIEVCGFARRGTEGFDRRPRKYVLWPDVKCESSSA